jgi:nicotinamidase-related amidase
VVRPDVPRALFPPDRLAFGKPLVTVAAVRPQLGVSWMPGLQFPPQDDPSEQIGAQIMTSEPIRDPKADPLLTPDNCALLVIDYQPSQFATVNSMDRDLLTRNIVSVSRLAKTYGLPVVLSTVNVVANGQPPTIPELREVLSDSVELDRTQINSWEDVEFRRAVEATGRKKLVMTALWTEVCLAFPTLDALREGYEVYPVVDAVGGTSLEAHRAGLERVVQAGAQPISWVSLACELQRDWARTVTVPDVVEIVLTSRLLAGV